MFDYDDKTWILSERIVLLAVPTTQLTGLLSVKTNISRPRPSPHITSWPKNMIIIIIWYEDMRKCSIYDKMMIIYIIVIYNMKEQLFLLLSNYFNAEVIVWLILVPIYLYYSKCENYEGNLSQLSPGSNYSRRDTRDCLTRLTDCYGDILLCPW